MSDTLNRWLDSLTPEQSLRVALGPSQYDAFVAREAFLDAQRPERVVRRTGLAVLAAIQKTELPMAAE